MVSRGDVCDKWHRYCGCGRKLHINAVRSGDCGCGNMHEVSRVKPASREGDN